MATDRTTIIRGPGTVLLDDLPIYDASGITAEVETDTQDIPSSVSGILNTIKTDQRGRIRFTPCGAISSELLTALFPHQTPSIGSSLLGATDVPLTVHSVAGVKVLFHAACLTSAPELILSPVATAFGEVEFTALLAKGKDPTAASALYTASSAAYASGGPDPANITAAHYTGTWGATTIADTLDGWRVQVEIASEPVITDSLGTIDLTLSSVTVRASCTPVGLTESAILALLPALKTRGTSVIGASDLIITAPGGLTVTLKNAALLTGPLAWGSTTLRAGQIGFVAHRAFTSGVPGQLYSVQQAAGGTES